MPPSLTTSASFSGGSRIKGRLGPPPYNYTILPGNEPQLLFECLERRPWWRETPDKGVFHFWWGGNGQKFLWQQLAKDGTRQLINKLEGHSLLCTKTKLANTMREYAASTGIEISSLIPETFVLVSGSRSADAAAFDAAARALAAKSSSAAAAAPIAADSGGPASPPPPPQPQVFAAAQWIVKPSCLNRGRGIQVFPDAAGVLAHIGAAERGTEWVVQRYIANPMLVRNRKFDIRQLVLFTPQGQVYMYRDSYVRTCSKEFSLGDDDLSVHLTNDAVQKHLDSYGQFEDANKLSYKEFEEVLREQARKGEGPDVSVDGHIWPAMEAAVAHVFRAAGKRLNPRSIDHCFELLGFDFMVDSAGAVRLIEINTSPALFRHGRVLTELFPALMEELFQKVVDPLFPPPPGAAAPEPLSRFHQVQVGAAGPGAPQRAASMGTTGVARGTAAAAGGAGGARGGPGAARSFVAGRNASPTRHASPERRAGRGAGAGGATKAAAAVPPPPAPASAASGGAAAAGGGGTTTEGGGGQAQQ